MRPDRRISSAYALIGDQTARRGSRSAYLIRPALYRTEYAKQYWIEEAIEKGLEERRLTQEQACVILGIEPTYLKDILSGTITPTHEMAERIALLLNFDPKIFFLDDEEE